MSATRAEGPHLRAALWVSGCSIRCPGCCNPELFDENAGSPRTLVQLQRWTQEAVDARGVEGVSVLGGEPLEQWEALCPWLAWVKEKGLGVVVFSGYRWQKVRANLRYEALTQLVDTLVDGPFVRGMPEPQSGRTVIGSSNQQLHHFSARYAQQALWEGPARAHVDIQANGQLRIHGAPDLVAKIRRRLHPQAE